MNARGWHLPSALVALAGVMVLVETVWFGSQRPEYSHIANTISELGEMGEVNAQLVALGFFLPVGLLVWAALWLVAREVRDKEVLIVLACLSGLGTGYAVAAFFPCDPGGPIFGSWRTQVHNVAGFIDYAGTGIGLLLMFRYFARRGERGWAGGFLVCSAVVLVGLGLMMVDSEFHVRGAVQRVVEAIQFAGVFWACWGLAKEEARSKEWRSDS